MTPATTAIATTLAAPLASTLPTLMPPTAWLLYTRLGEAQLLLPAMALASLWLWHQPGGRRLALRWWLATLAAAALTTASKIAFIGWGLGWARWDYTGISGHAMFSAAVLPLLLRLALGPVSPRATGTAAAEVARPEAASAGVWQRALPWLPGLVLAGLVAQSRVVLGAHSLSEVLLGAGLGGLATWISRGGLPTLCQRLPLLASLALLLGLALAMHGAPRSRSHDRVIQFALLLSGHERPYTRQDLHRPATPPHGSADLTPPR